MKSIMEEYESKPDGQLFTQVEYWEFKDLMVELLREDLSLSQLAESRTIKKKERVHTKKLIAIGQLLSNEPSLLHTLMNRKWKSLQFRCRGSGMVDAEIVGLERPRSRALQLAELYMIGHVHDRAMELLESWEGSNGH